MVLNEMAYTRKEFIKDISSYKDRFMEHVYKVAAHPNHELTNHWIRELTTWCILVDDYRLKPNNKRPKKEEFLKNMLPLAESPRDVKPKLGSSLLDEPFVPTDKQCVDFKNKWNVFRVKLAEEFVSETIHDRNFYSNLIRNYLLK